jgi:putative membrane protein
VIFRGRSFTIGIMTITGVAEIDPFAIAAAVVVIVVAALHAYFLVLEMFLWRQPLGLRTFRITQEAADSSAVLAANQGLYNGFLAAGLLWGLIGYGIVSGRGILTFFLLCVIVAGLYGAATVSRRIALIQALPAAIALVLVWLA